MRLRWLVGVAGMLLLTAASCPIPDGDGDGVPDIIDQCPTVPGPVDNLGCPLPVLAPYDCANPPALAGFIPVKGAIKDRYIVVLKERGRLGAASVQSIANKFGAKDLVMLSSGFAGTLAEKELKSLVAEPSVQYVQQEGKKFARLSWGLDRVDAREGLDGKYEPGATGAGVHAYVNDTGVTKTADLGDRLSDDCFSTITYQGCNDGHGHGTHVAGTIAGTKWGIAKEAIVHSVRFLDANGSGTDTDAIRSLDWIAAHAPGGSGVVNASWGGSPAPAVDAAVCRVIESGKVFVAAAGNEESDSYSSTPARVLQVITVGAMDDSDKMAYFSNFGPGVDLFAPGVDIESDTPAGGTTTMSGTSMACPHVVGGAALYLERNPGATVAQVHDGLVALSTPDTLTGLPSDTANKLLYVKEGNPGPTPTPTPEPTPVPTPVPTPTPEPPGTACPKKLAEGAYAYVVAGPYGQGWDTGTRVKGDPAFCLIIHGVQTNDCNLEGWVMRAQCEMELLGGCPVWYFRTDANPERRQCLQPSHPEMSCDHFGSVEYRDDPVTPVFEGAPAECGLQRDSGGYPMAGFFTVAHGKGQVQACKPDGSQCSGWKGVDH